MTLNAYTASQVSLNAALCADLQHLVGREPTNIEARKILLEAYAAADRMDEARMLAGELRDLGDLDPETAALCASLGVDTLTVSPNPASTGASPNVHVHAALTPPASKAATAKAPRAALSYEDLAQEVDRLYADLAALQNRGQRLLTLVPDEATLASKVARLGTMLHPAS